MVISAELPSIVVTQAITCGRQIFHVRQIINPTTDTLLLHKRHYIYIHYINYITFIYLT